MGGLLSSIILLIAAGLAHAGLDSEADHTAAWCGDRGLVYDIPGDGSRPDALRLVSPSGRFLVADCIGSDVVVEVDWSSKYRQGIVQAVEYGYASEKIPVLLLIVRSRSDCRYVVDAWRVVTRGSFGVIVVTTGAASCVGGEPD